MTQAIILGSSYMASLFLVGFLVRLRKLTLRFASVWLMMGLVALLGSLIIPRTSLVNSRLGISPTGALLGLFGLTSLTLILMLAVTVNSLRLTQRRLLTEVAILQDSLSLAQQPDQASGPSQRNV